uniref:Sema domain-containing protein n=1 Tax=Tetranychus urticae TaxID=32264 RepID=A0A158P4W4_TETUR
MFISYFLLTIVLCLFSEIAYSFRTPKHDMIFYYKTPSNVFLTNQNNKTTYYGIYLAGKTIYINVPKSVVNVSDLVNWKVINVDKDRLMFVHQNIPRILIERKTIKNMTYSGKLTGPIIAFGDDEALHVPTILNPHLTEPPVDWNYLELLRFDVESEKVSVIGRLPAFQDDWKYIAIWKMTDYIHFESKLYLLIMRIIWNEKTANFTQEISIMRLCLVKGIELISSVVEMHFTRPEFNTNELHDVIFVHFAGLYNGDTVSKSFYLCTTQHLSNQGAMIVYYYFDNLFPLFEQTAKSCSSGAKGVTLLYHHLRSEAGECEKTIHESCVTKGNIVPSMDISNLAVTGKQSSTSYTDKNQVLKMHNIVVPFPFNYNYLFIYTRFGLLEPIVLQQIEYNASTTDSQFKTNLSGTNIAGVVKAFHINKHPFEGYYLTNVYNQVRIVWNLPLCSRLTTCTQCFMYGSSIDCVWSNSICTNATIIHQPKTKIESNSNNCFKVINISPLIFNPSLPKTLTIILDAPLLINKTQETFTIRAGPHNRCTNIKTNGAVIECSMKLVESGEFNIVLNLVNDNYADVYSIGAVSVDKVTISAPNATNTFAIIFILSASLLLSVFLLLAYKKWNKQRLDRLKIFAALKKATKHVEIQRFIKPVDLKISPKINAKVRTHSAKSKEQSIKLVKSLHPIPSHSKSGEKESDKSGTYPGPGKVTGLVASQKFIAPVEPSIAPKMNGQSKSESAKLKESGKLVKSLIPMPAYTKSGMKQLDKFGAHPDSKDAKNAKSQTDSAKLKKTSGKLVKSLNQKPTTTTKKRGKKQSDKLREKMKAKRRSPKNAKKLVASQESIMVVEPPISPQMDTGARINPVKSKESSSNLFKSLLSNPMAKLNQASNLNSTMPAKSKEPSSNLLQSLLSNPMAKFGQAPNFKSNELVKSSNELPPRKVDKPLKEKPMDKLEESAKPRKPSKSKKPKKPKKSKKPRKSK